jgi:hypothetical protein
MRPPRGASKTFRGCRENEIARNGLTPIPDAWLYGLEGLVRRIERGRGSGPPAQLYQDPSDKGERRKSCESPGDGSTSLTRARVMGSSNLSLLAFGEVAPGPRDPGYPAPRGEFTGRAMAKSRRAGFAAAVLGIEAGRGGEE